MEQHHVLFLAAVLGLGLAAQWIAWRLRLPAILLLLVFGFAAGRYFDPEVLIGHELLFSVVSLSVAVIFLVIVGTVAIYGLTAGPLARWLKIAEANPQGILFAGAEALVREIAAVLDREGYAVLLVDTNQRNIAAARMAGLDTCWANICSQYAREELDLGGIGRLLAMTPNDGVNALAAAEFVELFGRAEVYQLPHKPAEIEHDRLAPSRTARMLFEPQSSFSWLTQRLHGGAVVKKTTLSDEFDYQAFRDLYGDSAVVLFTIEPSGNLTVCTAENRVSPPPGQTLISLVEPVEA